MLKELNQSVLIKCYNAAYDGGKSKMQSNTSVSAEDVASDVIVKCLSENLMQFDESYYYKAGQNRAIDIIRSNTRHTAIIQKNVVKLISDVYTVEDIKGYIKLINQFDSIVKLSNTEKRIMFKRLVGIKLSLEESSLWRRIKRDINKSITITEAKEMIGV